MKSILSAVPAPGFPTLRISWGVGITDRMPFINDVRWHYKFRQWTGIPHTTKWPQTITTAVRKHYGATQIEGYEAIHAIAKIRSAGSAGVTLQAQRQFLHTIFGIAA